MEFLTSAVILSWVVIGLLGLVVARLVQQVGELQRRTAGTGPSSPSPSPTSARIGLAPGSPAPDFDELRPSDRSEPVTLLFLSTDCRTCEEIVDLLDQWSPDTAIHLLYAGPAPDTGARSVADGRYRIHHDQARRFERYGAIATPLAVVVDETGRVLRSEPLGSLTAARRLLSDRPEVVR